MELPFESADDRALIEEEAATDPVFAKRLKVTLAFPDGEKRIAISARKAIVNELNPDLYPETCGLWKRLRFVVRDLMQFVGDSVHGIELEAAIRKEAVSRLSGLGDLGQFEIIGQLIGAVANVYSARIQSSAAKEIASEQLAAQMAQIQAQESMARAQTAMANAQIAQTGAPGQAASAASSLATNVASAASNMIDTISQPVVAGIPLWVILLGVFFLAEKA